MSEKIMGCSIVVPNNSYPDAKSKVINNENNNNNLDHLLIEAIKKNQIQDVKLLIKKGANVNALGKVNMFSFKVIF